MLVIRFADPRGIDFPYLLPMLRDSFMSCPTLLCAPVARWTSRCNHLHADDLAADGAAKVGDQPLSP
jgi:hypothetical protein